MEAAGGQQPRAAAIGWIAVGTEADPAA